MGRGKVSVAFALSRTGRLLFARISRSSGRRALDQAALASVRGASPFPAPPARLKGARHRFVFPFYFQ
jgi:protein TonB